ncbi:GDP-L-galactose phosphorylase 1-like [Typha latifolia]|uniref:GDP-L-galactose phosphorylase 1-like n=1 Tax=Typha latifolia TaxID=4733 RepID=UPI003C2EB73F
MVSVEQVEGRTDYPFLRQNSGSDQSKDHQVTLKGVKIHLYKLGIIARGNDACGCFPCAATDSQSLLDSVLLSQWEHCAWKGQLKYDVTTCQTKVINGEKKFVVQLNERWNSLFLEEFENNFLQPLGPISSNHIKSHKENVLFCVSQGEKESSEVVLSTMLPKDGILIIANANPVEYGHVFLVPYNINRLPLFLDKKMVELILRTAVEVNSSSFRVFFDSIISNRSDHIIFQASYFANPLPVELFPTVPVYADTHRTGIHICEVADYPLKTLVFMGNNLDSLSNIITEICSNLRVHGSAFNLLITDFGTKIFLFPQAQSLIMDRPISTWECGGYFVYGTKFGFDNASETEILKRMASVSLDDSSFQSLKHLCCSIAVNLYL